MTSRRYALPASVVLFGTIYAVALAVAPKSSAAAQQPVWSYDTQHTADSLGPAAHAAHGNYTALESHTIRAASSCPPDSDAATTERPPAPTFRRAVLVPEVGQAATGRLVSGVRTTVF